jgi:hypothetical protein
VETDTKFKKYSLFSGENMFPCLNFLVIGGTSIGMIFLRFSAVVFSERWWKFHTEANRHSCGAEGDGDVLGLSMNYDLLTFTNN